jgi:hypothetical protein
MGPAPSLATYEAQATAEYAPQLAADQTTAAATHTANENTLATEKSSVGTQYDIQEQTLNDTVKTQAAQISSLYSTRLLGNFSGLQGNDMGMMFSKANQDETNIETQRTNAVNAINTSIANEDLNYTASESALTSKYQGLEAGAASTAYNSAVKDYNTQQYQQEQLDLGYAKLNEQASASANSLANSTTTMKENLGASIEAYFQAPNAKDQGYTENTVLKDLYTQYGALGTAFINKSVYDYRRNALGF